MWILTLQEGNAASSNFLIYQQQTLFLKQASHGARFVPKSGKYWFDLCPTVEHLDCSQFFTIINNAQIMIFVQKIQATVLSISLGQIPGSGIVGSMCVALKKFF